MDDLAKVLAMERAVERLGVEIRREPLEEELHVSGGLCVVHGKRVVFVPDGIPLPERVAILADALKRLPTDDLWLPPAIRSLIE